MLVLARVPVVEVVDPEGRPYRRPRLPAVLDRGHGWGQASSEGVGTAPGSVLVWARGSSAEVDLIQQQARSEVLRVAALDADADRMVAALRAGDVKGARAEFVAAYREEASAEEGRVRAQRGRARIVALVATFGLVVAAGLIAARLGWAVGYTLGVISTLHADNFSVDGAMGSRTMSDGLGTWADTTGTSDTVSGLGRMTDVGEIYDSAMDAGTTDQRATATFNNNQTVGPFVRRGSAGNFYCVKRTSGSRIRLLRRDAGVDTQLGSDGASSWPNGTVVGVEALDDQVAGLHTGSIEAGPVTDTTFPTGRAGILSDTTSNVNFDDFLVETEPVAAGNPLLMMAHHHGGAR